MERKRLKLSDAVRRAVRDYDGPRAAICRAALINEGLLSHFMAGQKGLSLASLDRLTDVLGLRIVQEGPQCIPPPAKKGRPRKQR